MDYGHDTILKILMERDGLSELNAENIIEDVSRQIEECVHHGDIDILEDIIADELGLEPDFLEYFLPI